MAVQKRVLRTVNRSRVGTKVRVLVDGPSPEHPLVLRGRLEGQAPEIDSMVYLSDADPATCRPGQLIEARVASARGYNLVVSPTEEWAAAVGEVVKRQAGDAGAPGSAPSPRRSA